MPLTPTLPPEVLAQQIEPPPPAVGLNAPPEERDARPPGFYNTTPGSRFSNEYKDAPPTDTFRNTVTGEVVRIEVVKPKPSVDLTVVPPSPPPPTMVELLKEKTTALRVEEKRVGVTLKKMYALADDLAALDLTDEANLDKALSLRDQIAGCVKDITQRPQVRTDLINLLHSVSNYSASAVNPLLSARGERESAERAARDIEQRREREERLTELGSYLPPGVKPGQSGGR